MPTPITIIALGGGEMRARDTLAMDAEIVRATRKRRPRALFIPTASSDNPEYYERFRAEFGGELGADPDVLYLIERPPPPDALRASILGADLVYVGGGNTLRMVRLWRRLGVDRLLREAAGRGTVLSGVSAGALCWFAYGHSDSMRFTRPEQWDYIRVRGLGFVPATGCPHYDGEGRARSFEAMIAKVGGLGIAVDDLCAFDFRGDRYRVLAARPGAAAYRVYRHAGAVVTDRLTPGGEFAPLEGLFRLSPSRTTRDDNR